MEITPEVIATLSDSDLMDVAVALAFSSEDFPEEVLLMIEAELEERFYAAQDFDDYLYFEDEEWDGGDDFWDEP